MEPMKVPRKQSVRGIPRTPQATLMPDQGTIPMRRRTVRRTQAGDLDFVDTVVLSLSNALFARARGFGKKCVMNGAIGVARRVANIEPMVVRMESKMVAKIGENRAPARTFC